MDDYFLAECDGLYIHWDANDLLALMNTWQAGDISRTSQTSPLEQGDLAAALAKIKAKVLLMPAKGDMFFPVEENESEIRALKNTSAELAVIPSEMGHAACGGFNPPDTEFMIDQLQKFINAS
ncbi:hypothetical protein EIP86_010986 [Pleurotus ostreatoroseus]|nr:hypothetical protein EIP86_010986 [Pleurotus ostreatoroseus]